ncbi:5915_t:CDS:10, partial [Racocetra fulgida]
DLLDDVDISGATTSQNTQIHKVESTSIQPPPPLATPLAPTTVKVEPDESKKEGSSNVTDDQSNEWPFENVCESLCVALFKHGACIGLREILKVHGHGAGRRDSDDDVRAVAASILIPIAEHFVTLSAHKIPEIVTVLWDCLKDLKDDLTASTASVMDFLDHRTFRLVFQNMIVEEKSDVLKLSLQVWSALVSHVSKSGQENKIITFTAQYIRTWFMIIMTPLGTPIDRRLFFVPDGPVPMETSPTAVSSTNLRRRSQGRIQTNDGDDVVAGHNIDTGMLQQDFALVSVDTVLRGRVTASKGLGMLMSHWPNESLETSFEEIIISCLSSSWASNKQLAAVIIEEWARSIVKNEGYDIQTSLLSVSPLAVKLSNHMISILESEPPKFYSELISILRRIRGECQALLNTFVSVGKIDSAVIPTLPSHVLGEVIQSDALFPLFSIETAVELSAATFNNLLAQVTGVDGKSTQARSDERQALNDRKRRVLSSIGYYESTKQKNDVVVFAAVAGAVVALRALPPKLNPVVRSIMNSIKTEENLGLQQRSAATLASLVELCASEDGSTRVNPNDKIVKNLCTFLCSDPTATPELQANRAKEGILSLQKAKEPDKGSSNNDSQNEDEELKSQKLIRRGAETALRQFSLQFGPKLFDIVPRLWTIYIFLTFNLVNLDVVQTMDAKILPYVIFLIVPILGRMSDVDENVRLAGIPDPPGLSTEMLIHRDEERKFLAQLLDSRKLDPYEIPVTIKAELRKYQQEGIPNYDVVIMSYDIVRNDIDDLASIHWNYCILDEGHVIKNGKTKITKAVKSVKANHRLILSGTPIQNNVLELWSLFDFLMPGFLGTEKQFNERFGKPILASRDSKSSSREQEAGALALEALHKQVLPFLLRRLKEDVLSDLPPKIIQDYYCELSDLQKQLYEQFAKSQAKSKVEIELETEITEDEGEKKKTHTHIFQALQYLPTKTSLHDLENAPKQLLHDCGIGTSQDSEDSLGAGAVSQHRALIFCQLKTMLDIIEKDLLEAYMPSVTYLRLDGSVDANKRHGIVQQFNKDPSIDVLLLTTHIVIFVEHDWNPMKDLQAMDHAHRIGQKKTVNVYRLITKGTLEEKIMGYLNIANSIVNQQNSGLQSMDTEQILDLFNVTTDSSKGVQSKSASITSDGSGFGKGKKITPKNLVEGLENLWDDKQYEDLNLDNFIESLNSE